MKRMFQLLSVISSFVEIIWLDSHTPYEYPQEQTLTLKISKGRMKLEGKAGLEHCGWSLGIYHFLSIS